jgi:ubiquinone/menaquinone biosynthesis C-methylase UbiE
LKANNLNPFENPALVDGYEAWYEEPSGRRADRLEKALLRWLLTQFPSAQTILEVGCGTGHFTRWFAAKELPVTGIDISMPMLVQATRFAKLPYVQGHAYALPFPGGSFDLVALITTLEFIPDPILALAEAWRVARYGLVLGVLNRQSCLGRRLKEKKGPVWGVARFFSPAELAQTVRRAADESAAITWRTTLWPVWSGRLTLPWGGFIGMAVRRRFL